MRSSETWRGGGVRGLGTRGAAPSIVPTLGESWEDKVFGSIGMEKGGRQWWSGSGPTPAFPRVQGDQDGEERDDKAGCSALLGREASAGP